jgi:hypothetical protein
MVKRGANQMIRYGIYTQRNEQELQGIAGQAEQTRAGKDQGAGS